MDPASLASLLPLALTAGLVAAVLVAVSFASSRETQRARADRLAEELEKLRRAARPTRDGGLSTDITASRLAVVGAAQGPEPEPEPEPEPVAPEGESTTALLEEIARRLAALSSDVRSATFPPPLAGPSPWEAAADRLLAIAEALEPPEAPSPERPEPETLKEGLTTTAALGSVASALTRAAGAEARLREASQVAERQQERVATALTEAGEGAQRADRAADALAPFGAQVAGFADRLNLLSLSLPGISSPQPGTADTAAAAGVDELHALFDELRRAARDIASGARRVAQAARETREATDAALATVATASAGAEAAERLEAAHADAARALAEAQDALRAEEARRRALDERLLRSSVREDAVRSLLSAQAATSSGGARDVSAVAAALRAAARDLRAREREATAAFEELRILALHEVASIRERSLSGTFAPPS